MLDGGPVPGGKGSTILEIVYDTIQIRRNGVVSAKEIFQVLEKSKKNK